MAMRWLVNWILGRVAARFDVGTWYRDGQIQ
jgi:hypothetical protein